MKKFVSLYLVLAFLAAACSPLNQIVSESEAPAEEAAQEAQQTEDSVSEAAESEMAEAEEASAAEEAPAAEEASATPSTQQAEEVSPETDEQPLVEAGIAKCAVDPLGLVKNPFIAEVSNNDWQQGGGAEARLTVIEYGDFQ